MLSLSFVKIAARILRRLSSCLIIMLIVMALALPVFSWFLVAFGVPVQSLISPEGARWIFCSSFPVALSPFVLKLFALLMALSTAIRAFRVMPRRASVWLSTSALMLIFVLLMLWLAVSHSSPLLSIVGEIWPASPFFDGLPFIGSFCLMACAVLYAYLNEQVQSLHSFVRLLTCGLTSFADWMLVIILVSYVSYSIKYILS